MTAVLHILGVLFMLAVLWVVGGIVLFSPGPGGRPGVVHPRHIGWWIVGYWALVGVWIGIAVIA
jgi:hypothetical protein